ncbi:hypothetical protein THAOC_25036, partial [Thalassiosira oceanica]
SGWFSCSKYNCDRMEALSKFVEEMCGWALCDSPQPYHLPHTLHIKAFITKPHSQFSPSFYN